MRAMNVATAMKSGLFEIAKCECGKCKGDEHVVLVFKDILMNIPSKDVQSFCCTTADYVRVSMAYRCNKNGRSVFAWCEVRNTTDEFVLRTEPHVFSEVIVPNSASGETKFLGMLRVKGALFEAAAAANRRKAA